MHPVSLLNKYNSFDYPILSELPRDQIIKNVEQCVLIEKKKIKIRRCIIKIMYVLFIGLKSRNKA